VAQLSSEYSKAVKLLKTAHSVTVHHYGNKSINMAASGQLLAGGYLLLWKHGDAELGKLYTILLVAMYYPDNTIISRGC